MRTVISARDGGGRRDYTSPVMSTWVRLAVVASALIVSLASAQPSEPPPAYPQYAPGGAGPGGAGPGGLAGPAVPGALDLPYAQAGDGQDYCFTLKSAQTVSSLCASGFGACERQRQSAVSDGLATTDCVPWTPVACFQLGGDSAPSARWCAANLEDCEVWRRIDEEKNGKTGGACALRGGR
jgi:hypothetical protein